MLDVILVIAGIVLGLMGIFLFSPTLVAVAVIPISIPFIQIIVNDMLIKKWRQVTIMSLLVAAYISFSVWALSMFIDAVSFQDKLRPGIIIIGAGIIQLAWIFLVAIRLDSNGTQ